MNYYNFIRKNSVVILITGGILGGIHHYMNKKNIILGAGVGIVVTTAITLSLPITGPVIAGVLVNKSFE